MAKIQQAFTWLVWILCPVSLAYDYPFQDPSLPWSSRVDDLVGRLTLDEIAAQTTARYYVKPPEVKRLDIKPYVWITECLHGQRKTDATAFPQALGMAATFSRDIIFNISTAISYEVRAHWNNNTKHGVYATNSGLNCFSPLINLMRHPLWGRNQETYGEDPYLTGQMSVAFVQGLQGSDPRYVRVVGGCKHIDAYAGPDNYPISRHKFNAKVPMRDLQMTFLPAFKTCVKGGSINIMCSYNAVNGVPSCVNRFLLQDTLREEWEFKGFVISDDGATEDIVTNHKYLHNFTITVAEAIKAGCNMEVGPKKNSVFDHTVNAVKAGMVTEGEVRESSKKIFMARLRLGEFDPAKMVPYSTINTSVIQSDEHRHTALLAAQMSIVLLKNTKAFLPLKQKIATLAVVGPFSNNLDLVYGSYRANVMPKYGSTPYEAMKGRLAEKTLLAPGCTEPKCDDYKKADVKEVVIGADVTIVCLGLSDKIEEEHDRKHIDFPGSQLELLKDAVLYAGGKPVILLLFNGGPLDVTWAKLSDGVTAMLECFYPAQATGEAVYNILTMSGQNSVPAARLPSTWPAHLNQVPPITVYNMDGFTYRYFHGDPLYSFGYGLSYSNFKYSSLTLKSDTIEVGEDVNATVKVENQGPYDADEVVQIYMSWMNVSSPDVPKLTLVGFDRLHLVVGKPQTITFHIKAEQMAAWSNDESKMKIMPGKMILYAGGQQPYQRTRISSNVINATFSVK